MNAHVKIVMSPAQQLLTMTLGIVQTQLLNVAAQLKLADRLKDGPQSAVELAEATGMAPAALTRLMASLAEREFIDPSMMRSAFARACRC